MLTSGMIYGSINVNVEYDGFTISFRIIDTFDWNAELFELKGALSPQFSAAHVLVSLKYVSKYDEVWD